MGIARFLLKLILIILILFIVYFCYLKIVYSGYFKDSFSRLILCIAPKRTGKTTHAAKVAIDYYLQDIPVYSNMALPFTNLIDINDLGYKNFHDCVILWDEAALDADNRDFKNFDKKKIEFLRLQGHFKIRMYVYTQAVDVDKKIRDMADEIYLMKKIMHVFCIMRPVYKKITVENKTVINNRGKSQVVRAGELIEEYRVGSIFNSHILFLPRYRFFYDTHDKLGRMLEDPQVEYVKPTETMELLAVRKNYKKYEKRYALKQFKNLFRRKKNVKKD